MELLLLYVTCAMLFVSSLYLLRLFIAGSRRKLPPGPRALPLVGNLFDLGSNPHSSLARLAERHGPVMMLRLGTVTTVVVSSADAARDVLQRHDAALSARPIPDAARARDHFKHSVGWLPHTSPRWRAIRKVCANELFAPRCLDAQQALRCEKVQQLVSHVERLAREGAAVDVGGVAFTAVLNLLSCTIFSTDLAGFDESGEPWLFKDVIMEYMVAVAVPNLSDFFPALAPLDPQGLKKRVAGAFARLHGMYEEQIDRRLRERAAGEPPKNDFLDVLLDCRGAEDGKPFDRQTLVTLITDLFNAGSDTSSATVEWAMAELLQNPSAMAKARDELARVIGSKPEIEESDIGKLKYLQAIVKEAFRLHPLAPLMLPRLALTTAEVGGYEVPEGARVLVNVWAIGRSKDAWPEPHKFMPERFMDLEEDIDFRGRHFELLTFGSGRRICPGIPLADRMVHLMLASLLHRFEWSLPVDVEKNGLDMTDKFGTVVMLAKPLHAIAKPV